MCIYILSMRKKAMTTGSIRFFCSPEEFYDLIIDKITQNHGYISYVENIRDGVFDKWTMTGPLNLDAILKQKDVYGYENRQFSVVLDKFMSQNLIYDTRGFLRLCIPRMKDDHLMMGEISFKTGNSDSNVNEFTIKIFNSLRRIIKNKFKKGVWSRNINNGAKGFYNNIYYSDKISLDTDLRNRLLTQYGDGYGRYSLDEPV
jgi:hypothetical protein